MKFKHIQYKELNSRQRENYNFQKAAAVLADYGFNCLRLTDDWQGADFIAVHIDGEQFLKIQLKGGMTIDPKYEGKNIYIAFFSDGVFYVCPHDELRDKLFSLNIAKVTWDKGNAWSRTRMPKKHKAMMEQYALTPAKK